MPRRDRERGERCWASAPHSLFFPHPSNLDGHNIAAGAIAGPEHPRRLREAALNDLNERRAVQRVVAEEEQLANNVEGCAAARKG